MTGPREILEARARAHQARAAVRAWQYRQRHHAHGVWFRLRRLLAGARRVYVVSPEEVDRLRGEGFTVSPVGQELVPARHILVVPADRIVTIAGRRELPVRLSSALLTEPCWVIEPFPGSDP